MPCRYILALSVWTTKRKRQQSILSAFMETRAHMHTAHPESTVGDCWLWKTLSFLPSFLPLPSFSLYGSTPEWHLVGCSSANTSVEQEPSGPVLMKLQTRLLVDWYQLSSSVCGHVGTDRLRHCGQTPAFVFFFKLLFTGGQWGDEYEDSCPPEEWEGVLGHSLDLWLWSQKSCLDFAQTKIWVNIYS